jgi:hypothetical protein
MRKWTVVRTWNNVEAESAADAIANTAVAGSTHNVVNADLVVDPAINIVSPDGKHRFSGVTKNAESNGSYTSRCACGFVFTGPSKLVEPDIEKRKDAAWSAIAQHFVDEVIGYANKALGDVL